MLRLALLLLPLLSFAADEAVMEDVDSNNTQEGSLNTNTVGSTVSSNNQTEDRSVSNTYNGAGSSLRHAGWICYSANLHEHRHRDLPTGPR